MTEALSVPGIGGPKERRHARAAASDSQLHWEERYLLAFGTQLRVFAGHERPDVLALALDDAMAVLQHLHHQLSLFDDDGVVRQLNRRGGVVRPHPDLVAVLRLAQEVSQRSFGAFDVTVQPLWQAWHEAARSGRSLPAGELKRARDLIGWRDLRIGADEIRLVRSGMAVTLNGIAQGYAADRCAAVLRAKGVSHALIDTGEWRPIGSPPDQRDWMLALAGPRGRNEPLGLLRSDGRAIACSSDAEFSFDAQRRNHHILDPRSGASPPGLAAVTVLAPNCALADALTKVFFMGGARAMPALARSWGVDVLAMDKAGGIHRTAGFPLEAAAVPPGVGRLAGPISLLT